MEFTQMSRKWRSNKESESQKTVEFAPLHDPFSMGKAVEILNIIDNVDNYTLFKVLNELHKSDSKAAFIMLRPDGRRG